MVNLNKVTLDKQGDQRTVSLSKGTVQQQIHVNLNWDAPAKKKGLFASMMGSNRAPDLDLGCMYRLKTGDAGVIQPLGGNFGGKDRPPYIFLDKDDRSGSASDGENLYVYRPQEIDLLIFFAMIYEGAQDFIEVAGRMTLKDAMGGETFIRLSAPDHGSTFCVVASLKPQGDGVAITKEERYFPGHSEADSAYGFGFSWRAGSK